MHHSEELKPCPFCGSKAAYERLGTHRQSCIVTCEDCGCTVESGETDWTCGMKWNTRTITEELYYLLKKQSREVFDLAHNRPIPSSIATVLCNMTERHEREIAAFLRLVRSDRVGERPALRSVHCQECAFYDACTRPELKMNYHQCLGFSLKGKDEK